MRISDWSSDVCSSDLCIDLIERGRADATLIASAQDQNAHAIGKRTERRCRLAHLKATDDLLQLHRTLAQPQREIGSAPWRERVWKNVYNSGDAGSLKKKNI